MNRKTCLAILAAVVVALLPASSCGTGGNYAPVINSLQAEAEWTFPSSSLEITCNASDRDGDELTFNWSASAGNITGSGAKVTWTAPEEIGIYYIAVVVSDGQGGNDTEAIPVIVATGTLSIIENIIVTADHKYLKETSTGYKVGKGQEYHIACNVSQNISGEPICEWLFTGGETSGEGCNITWTAPNTSGDVTVTSIVFDGVGNMDKKSILLTVVSCSSCEFK